MNDHVNEAFKKPLDSICPKKVEAVREEYPNYYPTTHCINCKALVCKKIKGNEVELLQARIADLEDIDHKKDLRWTKIVKELERQLEQSKFMETTMKVAYEGCFNEGQAKMLVKQDAKIAELEGELKKQAGISIKIHAENEKVRQGLNELEGELEKVKGMNKLMETHHGTLSFFELQAENKSLKDVMIRIESALHRGDFMAMRDILDEVQK